MPFVNITIYEGHGKDRKDEIARRVTDTVHGGLQAAARGGVGGLQRGDAARLVRGRQPRQEVSAVFEKLGTGFLFTEGPLWHPTGKYLLFSDMPGDHLRRWSAKDGVTTLSQAVQHVQRAHLGSAGPAARRASTPPAR